MYKQMTLTLALAIGSTACAAQGTMDGIATIIHGKPETADVIAIKAQERIAIAQALAGLSATRVTCEAGCSFQQADPVAMQQISNALAEPTEAGFWSGVRDVSQTLITTAGGIVTQHGGTAIGGMVAMEGFKALKDSGGEHHTVNGNGTVGGGTYQPQTSTPTVVDTNVVETRPEVVNPVVVDPVVVNPVVVNPEVVTQTNTTTTTPALSLGE